MKKKKLLFILSSVLIIVALVCLPLYAWFVNYRSSILLTIGDIEIEAKGWYQIATPDDELTYEDELEDINIFKDIAASQIIAFRFEITNQTVKDATLSMRFSDFSDNIFRHFIEFYESPTLDFALSTKISLAAEENTAKLAYMLSDLYYIDKDGIRHELFEEKTMWEYSTGLDYVQGLFLPGIEEDPFSGDVVKHPINVYFTLVNNQTALSVEAYRNWLCGSGDDGGAGFGQERCAKLLGYTWEALPAADKTVINQYLDYFYRSEIQSINPGEEDLQRLNLDIKYFEFTAQNVVTT